MVIYNCMFFTICTYAVRVIYYSVGFKKNCVVYNRVVIYNLYKFMLVCVNYNYAVTYNYVVIIQLRHHL